MGGAKPVTDTSPLSICAKGDRVTGSEVLAGGSAGVVTRKKSAFRVALECHTAAAGVTLT